MSEIYEPKLAAKNAAINIGMDDRCTVDYLKEKLEIAFMAGQLSEACRLENQVKRVTGEL